MSDIMIEVEVSVECDGCGRDLVAVVNKSQIYVEICETCKEEARQEGYDVGYEEGTVH
jgi:hypothetical protein